MNEDELGASLYNSLLDRAQTVAGSVMSQDETPGQSGIHPAPAEFTDAQIAADPILHFFHYTHLPPKLRETSKAFFLLASHVVSTVPRNPERTVALRKLLEAKDAAVRANLPAKEITDKAPVASERAPNTDEEDFQIVETGGQRTLPHNEDRDGPIPFSG
jgi:hypothetical protein